MIYIFINLIILSFSLYIGYIVFKNRHIEKNLRNFLIEEKKINKSLLDYQRYLSDRVPFGMFSKDLDNLYDKEDSEEVYNIKKDLIKIVKKIRIALLAFFVFIIITRVIDMII